MTFKSLFCLFWLLSLGRAKVTWTLEGTLNFTFGIFSGALEHQNMSDLQNCVLDSHLLSFYYVEVMEATNSTGSDFETTKKIMYYIGLAMDQVNIAIDSCRSANKEDLPRLQQMSAIFKNPASLFVTAANNIWVNAHEVTDQLKNGTSLLQAGFYFEAGEYFGIAASIAAFGDEIFNATEYAESQNNFSMNTGHYVRVSRERTSLSTEDTRAYQVFSGYLRQFGVSDAMIQDVYNEVDVYGKDFWNSMDALFKGGERLEKNFKASFFLHQFANAVKRAIKQLYRKADDLFEKKEFKDYIECIGSIKNSEVTQEILDAMDQVNEAFKNSQYENVGAFMGTIDTQMCSHLLL